MRSVYSRWRLLQFMRRSLAPFLGTDEPLDMQRVPPERFRSNIESMALLAAGRGIPVLFATEPSAHPLSGVPEYIVESRYAVSKQSALELWERYNEITREVATRAEGRHLADLDALISGRGDVARFFTADGIHFSREGIEFVAEVQARIIAPLLEPRGGRPAAP